MTATVTRDVQEQVLGIVRKSQEMTLDAIKQVVETLKRDLPRLSTFVTLSPAPGFARWLAGEHKREDGERRRNG